MRALIPTIGSRGDVQPFVALAQGLSRAGHSVTLATHPAMRALVEAHGVTFAPIGPAIDLAREAAAIRQRARNALAGLIRVMRLSFDMLERSHDDILALCREADLVVVPASSAAGKNEADQLSVPYLSVTLMPWAIPWDDPERPMLKRAAYGAIDKLIGLITTLPLNRMRRRLGLPPVGQEGFTSLHLNLIPVSPAVYPPNPLWVNRHQMVGYWFADPPGAWGLPTEVLDFLAAGEAPLVVSLGAMSRGSAPGDAGLFVEAIKRAGVRAIVQGWDEELRHLALPPEIYAAGPMPHSWLLPCCAGAVHHGGYGTTAAGLGAGIPALVIPHIADQFYWGQRVYELGAGPHPISRSKLDVEKLAAGMKDLADNAKRRAAAAALGECIRAERGLEHAVRLIEETF